MEAKSLTELVSARRCTLPSTTLVARSKSEQRMREKVSCDKRAGKKWRVEPCSAYKRAVAYDKRARGNLGAHVDIVKPAASLVRLLGDLVTTFSTTQRGTPTSRLDRVSPTGNGWCVKGGVVTRNRWPW